MKNSKKAKVYKYIMIVSGFFTVMTAISDFIIKQIIKLKLNIDIPSGSSSSAVGIIGGADGPTTILLAENTSLSYKYVLLSIFLPVTIICFLFFRKYSKSK